MQIVFVRAFILYILIVIAMRSMGKRQLGQLSAGELVVALMLSDLASVPMQDTGIPLLYGLIPIIVLVGLEFLFAFGEMKSIRFRALLSGRPAIVLRDGKIDQRALAKNRMTVDEFIEELRKKDVTDLKKLRYVILEPGGQISTVLYSADSPATPKDFAQKPKDSGLPLTLISDGRIIQHNLEYRELDRAWVERTLKEHGGHSPRDVFLLTIDDSGAVYVEPKEKT